MLSDHQYDSRVRIGIITVITVLVFSPVIMAGSTNILRYIQDKRATSVSMVDEFQGLLDTDHPPFGEKPANFIPGLSLPEWWPADPIPAEKVPAVKKAISVYNSRIRKLYPDWTVTYESVKRAYGRNLAYNIRHRWQLGRKEKQFVLWCRNDADLVYRHPVVMQDELHHKNERVEYPPTNFDYVNDTSGKYKDYTFWSSWDDIDTDYY